MTTFSAADSALGYLIEHADLNEDRYRDAIVERLRRGLKLVPADWPRAGEAAAK